MKKLLSVFLSAVIVVSMLANLLAVGAETAVIPESTGNAWTPLEVFQGQGSDHSTSENADGSYNLSAKESAYFLSNAVYNLSEKDISFKFNSTGGWLLLSVTKNSEPNEIAKPFTYEETPTRLDFLAYYNNNDSNVALVLVTPQEGGAYDHIVINTVNYFNGVTHTFGLRNVSGNWYPAIDGKVLTASDDTVKTKINTFMASNSSNARFAIGANGNNELFTIENVKAVGNNGIWQTHSTEGIGSAAKTDDNTTELNINCMWAECFSTIETYDITQKEVEFVMPNFGASDANAFLYIGVGTNGSNPGADNMGLGLRPNQANGKGHLLSKVYAIGFAEPYSTGEMNIGLSPEQKHTFGVRLEGGKYYPALDGKVIKPDNANSTNINTWYETFNEYITKNNGQLRFIFMKSSNELFSIKNVKIVDKKDLRWTNYDNYFTIQEDKPGIYSQKGTSRVYTTQKIDLATKDVTFKFDETVEYMYLAFSSDLGAVNSGFCDYDNPQFNNCIEFTAHKDGDKLGTHLAFVRALNNNKGDDWLAANYASATNTIDFSVPHSYGLRKYNDNWYLALDGVIINTGVTSERLDTLMASGNTEFYVTVGSWGQYYTAEGLEITERKSEPGDANYDGAVNIVDLVRVKKLATDVASPRFVPLADINNDDNIDNSDLVYLKQKLLGQ